MTKEQIAKYAELQGINLDVAEGSLATFEKGNGELPAMIFDAEATRELFSSVRSAYFAARGVEEPGFSKVDKAAT